MLGKHLNHTSEPDATYYQLRQIRRVRKSLSAASKLFLVLALVHSWCIVGWTIVIVFFTHCLGLVYSCSSLVLTSAARLIRSLGRFDHIIPVLFDLHWLLYPQCISHKICLLMFKCLKGMALAYVWSLCWHCSCCGSFWFEICSSRWSRCARTEQVVSSIPGSVGYISHVHGAYDYLGPFGVLWVHMAWHKNCVEKKKWGSR